MGALWGSLWISVASVVLAALIGIPLAFLFARYDLPGGRVLGGLVALPAVLPPLVGVLAFLFLYGETGFVSLLVQRTLGLSSPPWRLQGAGAILLVHAYSMYVYFYLFVRAGAAVAGRRAYEAAASLGAGRWRTLRRVVLPQLYPALGGAALLTFMTALASFSAPYIFGGGFRVMPTQIVATRLNGDDRLAMVETISLTLVALLALWLFRGARPVDSRRGRPQGRGPGAARAKPPAPARACRRRAGDWRPCCCCPTSPCCWSRSCRWGPGPSNRFLRRTRWRNYVTLVQDPVRARPLLNSLWLATVATSAAVAVALAGALSLSARRRIRGGRPLRPCSRCHGRCPAPCSRSRSRPRSACTRPGPGASSWWARSGSFRWAYLVRNLPITSRAILAGVRALDPSLDEAAATLGAGRGRTLRRITCRCSGRRCWRGRASRSSPRSEIS